MFHSWSVPEIAEEYEVDGIIFHAIKSCRTLSTGMVEARLGMTKRLPDIATVHLDSDHMDRRVISEAQMKNRVDAFFEAMALRRLTRASAQKDGRR